MNRVLTLSLAFAISWVSFSFFFALNWANELGTMVNSPTTAWIIIVGIALLPGFANAFICSALILDKRPVFSDLEKYPDVSILIAAYNESKVIEKTFQSIADQEYADEVEIYLVDDGSTDNTVEVAKKWIQQYNGKMKFSIINRTENGGKAAALNYGLDFVDTPLFITLDADTILHENAIKNIVTNIVSTDATAVAGSVIAQSTKKFISRLQEWDYFLAITAAKRVQSLLGGTLVAQGAFSIYRTLDVLKIGGWNETTVGEDIVLTWGFRAENYTVGYAENAIAFTHVPQTFGQFFRQRKRWSRGLIEAFVKYPKTLIQLKHNSPLIWFNATFPFLDLMFLIAFLPGMIAAIFFQWYGIVGFITLLLLPLALLMNLLMFFKQRRIFKDANLQVTQSKFWFVIYMLVYQILMLPATVLGYWQEILFPGSKSWETK